MDTIDCPKCEHEHTPNGIHEDDVGKMTCDKCGFEFIAEIDYDPSYSTSCVAHEYGDWEFAKSKDGSSHEGRWCMHCMKFQFRSEQNEIQ